MTRPNQTLEFEATDLTTPYIKAGEETVLGGAFYFAAGVIMLLCAAYANPSPAGYTLLMCFGGYATVTSAIIATNLFLDRHQRNRRIMTAQQAISKAHPPLQIRKQSVIYLTMR